MERGDGVVKGESIGSFFSSLSSTSFFSSGTGAGAGVRLGHFRFVCPSCLQIPHFMM